MGRCGESDAEVDPLLEKVTTGMEREKDKEGDRARERERDRGAERQRDRERERQTEREHLELGQASVVLFKDR